MFAIDPKRHRVIDLTRPIEGSGVDAASTERGTWADGTSHYVVNVHTHAGTHLESPNTVDAEWPRLESFDIQRFFGRAILADCSDAEGGAIDGKCLEASLAAMQAGDIVLLHCDGSKGKNNGPYLSPDGARWLVGHQARMIGFGAGVRQGSDAQMSKAIHEVLLAPGAEVLLLENLCGLEQLSKKEFFLIALPVRIEGVDSAWTRAIAIETVE